VSRILLIRLTALGDVVLVEPLVRAIRARLTGAEVDLVTEARHARLIEEGAGFDRVIAYDRHGRDAGVLGLARVLGRIGTGRYDAVVDLQGKLRTRLLAWRVPAGRRIYLRKRSFVGALRALLGGDRPIDDRHAVDLYLSALSPLIGAVDERLAPELRPGLPTGPTAAEPASAFGPASAVASGAEVRIGLGVGTAHPTKRWPKEHFLSLADQLSEAHPGARFVLIGGPPDLAELEAIRARVTRAVIDPLDVTSLDVCGLGRVIAGLDLLISVDSGPAHLAAASGVPVVVLFGPTSPRRWGPRGMRHRVASLQLSCSPCSNIGGARCPLPDHSHRCMRELAVELVKKQALEILGEHR
jgi:ADP-heptose:LPS heptosyltransferase